MEKIYILFFVFILAGCTGNPIVHDDPDAEYPSVDPSVEDIVKDVVSGQHNYIGRTVRIKGIVALTAKDFTSLPGARKDQITIQTGGPDVEFFILGDKVFAPSIESNKLITTYERQSSYDFYIFIARILPHRYIQNGYGIESYLIRDEIHTTIDTVVSDVRLKNNEYRYINSVIHLEGGAEVINRPAIIEVGVPDFDLPEEIYLKTKPKDVNFAVKDYISPTNRLDQFEDRLTYNFVLFITRIDEDADLLYATINSLLVVVQC
jgi:hypothetical protein